MSNSKGAARTERPLANTTTTVATITADADIVRAAAHSALKAGRLPKLTLAELRALWFGGHRDLAEALHRMGSAR